MGHESENDQRQARDDLPARSAFSDAELTQLALDAEPFDPFEPDVDRFDGTGHESFGLLPEWYMPAPGIARSKPRAAVMFGFAIALVVINVGGFCVTWGFPEFVWKW